MNKRENKIILFLLNDTDPVLLRVVKNKFKKDAGWESVIATKYDEAMSLFMENKPDGVLTEIIIGDDKGRTGFDFIEEINNKEKLHKSQVVIFTELSQDDDRGKAERLGVKHYFVKSKITLNELIKEINNII